MISIGQARLFSSFVCLLNLLLMFLEQDKRGTIVVKNIIQHRHLAAELQKVRDRF